jgi:hypothetical protein
LQRRLEIVCVGPVVERAGTVSKENLHLRDAGGLDRARAEQVGPQLVQRGPRFDDLRSADRYPRGQETRAVFGFTLELADFPRESPASAVADQVVRAKRERRLRRRAPCRAPTGAAG